MQIVAATPATAKSKRLAAKSSPLSESFEYYLDVLSLSAAVFRWLKLFAVYDELKLVSKINKKIFSYFLGQNDKNVDAVRYIRSSKVLETKPFENISKIAPAVAV